MRSPRLFAPETQPVAYYHCISRVVDRQLLIGPAEKEQFIAYLREYEAFCRVRVLTFALLSNHFHLLVEVPCRPAVLPSADQILEALSNLTVRQDLRAVRQRIEQFRLQPDPAAEQAFLATFHSRMWNLSAFLKLLKQRFSRWYNRRVGRKGTLWEERFKSVVVDTAGVALTTMAAYIDLNPVRANLVRDPKEYRWSGYGEAVAGLEIARSGIQSIVAALQQGVVQDIQRSLELYRVHLYGQGDEGREATGSDGRTLRGALGRAEVLQTLERGGALTAADYLRCRVRHFCDGAVFGTRDFVEHVFQANRHRFGPRRESGARRLPRWPTRDLFALRKLRLNVFG